MQVRRREGGGDQADLLICYEMDTLKVYLSLSPSSVLTSRLHDAWNSV
jgi:hypothetical protein